ncbi:hypothetical protein Lbru_2321 [Legionella brunensis]|uniref:Uncharacterized protein n=1 Tax=Legionella brunensis TaxID=29422 RepID=A0A0W0S4T1_9GAMM|nr:hypothetical protein Lbru_2321 [Legionella brunensis]
MLVKYITLVLLALYSVFSYADLIIPNKKQEFFDGFFSSSEKLALCLILIGVVILALIWYSMRKK